MSDEFRRALLSAAQAKRASIEVFGRGIVTCAGGERLFISVYVLLRILRETLGCSLPIQVWHFGGEEMSPAMRWLLSGLDVELVDASSFLEERPANIRNGWQLKSYAILQSRFAEVLFLDADQVPVRDPSFLFDAPEYGETGAVFWPDVTDIAAFNPIWSLVGLPPETRPSWESGQMLIDKTRHQAPLHLALYLNEQQAVVYRHLNGDKDTFLIAWRLARASAAIVPHRPFADTRALIQRGFDGAPLFQHRSGCKWTYGSDQYDLPGFVHMDACLSFLADLRQLWNGRSFFPPDRSLRARSEEQRLMSVCSARLILAGDEELRLELLPGHQLGTGRSIDRQNWYVIEVEEELELVIHDGDRETYYLKRRGDGYWFGHKASFPPAEATLVEQRVEVSAVGGGDNGLVDGIIVASGVEAGAGRVAEEKLMVTLRLMMKAEPALRFAIESTRGRSERLDAIIDQLLSESRSAPENIQGEVVLIDAGYVLPDGPAA